MMTIPGAIAATLFSLAVFAIGVYGVLRPARVARFRERLDAIGSTRSWDEVEPSDWRVSVTRITFGIVTVGGLLLLLFSFQTWMALL